MPGVVDDTLTEQITIKDLDDLSYSIMSIYDNPASASKCGSVTSAFLSVTDLAEYERLTCEAVASIQNEFSECISSVNSPRSSTTGYDSGLGSSEFSDRDIQSPSMEITGEIINDYTERSESEVDQSNLMWLVNFRLDALFQNPKGENWESEKHMFNPEEGTYCRLDDSPDSQLIDFSEEIDSESSVQSNISPDLKSYIQSPYNMLSRPTKPPFTYTKLIAEALKENCEMTVADIYQWITDRFPYYRNADPRWKNSVRHNLSINPQFKKGGKAPNGGGHLWTLASRNERRGHKFGAACRGYVEDDSPEAKLIRSIVRAEQERAQREDKENRLKSDNATSVRSKINRHEVTGRSSISAPQTFTSEVVPSKSLEQSAEEILMGDIQRKVEVQYMSPQQNMKMDSFHTTQKNDDVYLSPIQQEIELESSYSAFLTPLVPSVASCSSVTPMSVDNHSNLNLEPQMYFECNNSGSYIVPPESIIVEATYYPPPEFVSYQTLLSSC